MYIYERLRQHLDSFVLRAPEGGGILEILRIRFSPEEAEVALLMGPDHRAPAQVAAGTRFSESEMHSILEQMADKALVYKKIVDQENSAREIYSLLPTAVGLWETSFATGEKSPRTEQLAHLWREYYQSGWGKSMFGSAPFTRVIPVARSLSSGQEIMPYETAAELIKQYDFAVVIHCPCRLSAELDGAGCGKPTEVCFHFGDLAKFMAEKGYGREVSQDEVLQILDETEKAGLVHMVGNAKEMGVAMCSCCACCCTQLRAITEMQIPAENAMAVSRFIASVNPDDCVACELCVKRCHFTAVAMEGSVARFDGARCVGCGLCVTTCPTKAIDLKERTDYSEPLDTGMQLFAAWSEPASPEE